MAVPYQDGAEVGSNFPSHSLSCSLTKTTYRHIPPSPGVAWELGWDITPCPPAGHGEGSQLRRDEVQAVPHGEHGAGALQEAQRRALLGPGAQRVRARVHGLSPAAAPAPQPLSQAAPSTLLSTPIKDIFFKTNRRSVSLGKGGQRTPMPQRLILLMEGTGTCEGDRSHFPSSPSCAGGGPATFRSDMAEFLRIPIPG